MLQKEWKYVYFRELSNYFNTAIGYVFAVVCLILNFVLFFIGVDFGFFQVVSGFWDGGQASIQGYMTILPLTFAILVPAITMRIWAEEKKSGTIELLRTLPLTDVDLVLAKFLASWTYVCILILASIPLALSVWIIGDNFDWGTTITMWLGAGLMAGAYVALGMTISALTEEQIVSFILTFLISLIFFVINFFVASQHFPDSWRPLVGFLSLSYHYNTFSIGLLSLGDVFYYASFIALMLIFNVFILRNQLSLIGLVTGVFSSLANVFTFQFEKLKGRSIIFNFQFWNVVLVFILLNAVVAGFRAQLDWSRDGKNSVSDSTEIVLEKLNNPLLIEAYISRNMPGEYLALLEPLYATLNAIDRVGGDRVQLAIIDPDTPELRQQAEERGIRGEALEQRDDVEAKVSLLYFGVYMQLGEDSTIVELLSQRGLVTDLEYRILKEIKRLNRDSDESGIAFVEAPGSMTAYPLQRGQPPTKDNISVFQQLVTEEKGRLEQIDLTRPIPSTVETVFLTGMPRLEEIEFYHLDQFLMRGGNLILMLRGIDFQLNSGGGMQQFGGASMGFAQPAYEDLHRLNTWLGQYGILLNGNLVIEPEQGLLINDPLFRTPRPQPYMGWAGYTREDGNLVSNDPAMSGFDILVFPWTSTLDVRNAAQPNVNFETLVQTSGVALLRDSTAMDYGSINNVEGIDAGEPVNEPRPVAVLASGKFHSAFTRDTLPGTIDEEGNPGDPPADFREGQVGDTLSKLAVIATPYMVTDLMMGDRYYIPMPNFEFFRVNSAFLMNLLEQMEGDTDLIAARSRVSSPARIVLQSSILRFLFTVFHIFALPVLLAAYGMLRLVSRNRRRGVESAGGSNG